MECCIENCKNFPLFVCSCLAKGIFICENHFESHFSDVNNYQHIFFSVLDSSNLKNKEMMKKNNECLISKSQIPLNDSKLLPLNCELMKIDKEIQPWLKKLRSIFSLNFICKRNFKNVSLNDQLKLKSENQNFIIDRKLECKSYLNRYAQCQETVSKHSVRNFNKKLAYLISQDIMKWNSVEMLKNSYFNKIDIKKFPEVCRILKTYLSQELKEGIFKLVLLSRESPEISQGSANAITILNRLEYSISHQDLTGIKIPGADLSSSLIIGTNFKGSDLSKVNFSTSNLYSINFDDCNMTKTEFGESCLCPVKNSGTIQKFSPCGKYIVLCKENKRDFFIWDIKNQKIVKNYQTKYGFYFCEFSHCGNYLATADYGKIEIWDAKNEGDCVGTIVQVFEGIIETICCIAFSICNNWIAVGLRNHAIKIWDINTKKLVKYLCGHDQPVILLAFSKNYLISTSNNGFILIWNISLPKTKEIIDNKGVIRNVRNKQLLWKLKSIYVIIWAVLAHDEKYAFAASQQRVLMWNLEKQEENVLFKDLSTDFTDFALSPCSKFIAVSNKKCFVQVFDIENQTFTFQLPMKPSAAPKVAFVPYSDKLAIVGANENAKSWKYKLPSWKKPEPNNRKYPYMVLWTTNEDQFALISQEYMVGLIEIWSYKNKKVLREIKWNFGSNINPIFAFSPYGNYFVVSSYCSLQLYRLSVEFVRDYPLRVTSFGISREGIIALGFPDGEIEISELLSNKLLCKISTSTNKYAHFKEIKFLAFSYGSAILASASKGKVIRFWNVKTGEFISQLQIKETKWPQYHLTSMVFHPYEDYLAFTINPLSYVSVCHISSPGERMGLCGSSTQSYSQVKFSPCGSLLAAISLDFIIDLWNFEQRMLIYTLKGHLGIINSFDFSLCGKKIISGSDDMTWRCWNIEHLYNGSKEKSSSCLEWSLTNWELFASDLSLSGTVISKKNRKLLDFLSAKGKR